MKLKGEEGPCMDSAIDTPMAGERWHRGGGNDGRGGNERQTTERRCLNPPTAIRPGLNTAPPHISKGQGRYKGWLVLQKAYCSLVYVDWHILERGLEGTLTIVNTKKEKQGQGRYKGWLVLQKAQLRRHFEEATE